MTFQQLRYFTVLCEKGSFGRAADSLYITQQGLSMAIANLEAELSCQLFQRTAKGVVLTDAGKYFRVRVNRILSALRECTHYFQDNMDDPRVIKVAGSVGVLTECCAPLIRSFEQANPGYTVVFREYSDDAVGDEIENENADIGFAPEPLDAARFECSRFCSRSIVMLLREDHPLCNLDIVPLSALAGEDLIVINDGMKSTGNFADRCHHIGVSLSPRFQVREIGAVHRLVQQGWGIGLTIDTVAASLNTPGTVCRKLEGDSPSWNVMIFKKRNRVISEGAQLFLNFMKKHASAGF